MDASKSRSTPETEAVVKKFKNDCSIRECFEKFVAGLEAKEEHLQGIQESITESSKELDLRRKSAEEILEQVTKKEEELKQLQLAVVKGLRNWELKKKEMGLMLEKFEGQQKVVEEELGKFENFEKSLNEKWKIKENEKWKIKENEKWKIKENEKWKLKEKILAFRAEALDAKEKELIARERLLDLMNTDEPDKSADGADSTQQAECSTGSQSEKRLTLTLDSVKDTHNTPSPNQQPPMPLPAPQATTGIPEQGQQADEATSTPTRTPSSSVVDSRIVIEPLGDFRFSHHEECLRVIEEIFNRSISDKHLEDPDPWFFYVPADLRDTLFTEFEQFFRWSGEHDVLIRANWNNKCSQLFGSARRSNSKSFRNLPPTHPRNKKSGKDTFTFGFGLARGP